MADLPRSENCCCGGTIRVADHTDDDEVVTALQVHNATPQHRSWRLGVRLVRQPRTDTRDGHGLWVPSRG